MKNILFSFLALFSALPATAGEIFVSPYGDDAADGTRSCPLKTVRCALRMAREWRRTSDPRSFDGIVIRLSSSAVFRLDEPLFLRPEDSGTETSKTVITTDGEAKAVISGGVALTDKAVGAAVAEGDGRHSYITLDPPRHGGMPLYTRSLWADGTKLHLASHAGAMKMDAIKAFDAKARTITVPAGVLRRYNITGIADAPQLEMVVHQRWAIAILRVADIRINGDDAVLSFMQPESMIEFEHPWPQPVVGGEHGTSSFALRNARQFLDDGDEWWQDYATGTITLPAKAGGEIVAPRLSSLVVVSGSEYESVHDIIFRNISFEHSAWKRPSTMGHVTLQGGFPIVEAYKLVKDEGLPWAKTLENQAWTERPEAAVSVSRAQRVDFVQCAFRHLAATALDYVGACSDVRIEENEFRDIGGTAILIGSFAEGATEVHRPLAWTIGGKAMTEARDRCYTERFSVRDNVIDDATNEDWGAVGIGCGFVREMNIEGNSVSNVNYSGIAIGWGWTPEDTGMRDNRIVGNRVSQYAKMLYDAGGIYTMSNQPRSVIRDNDVSAPYPSPYATNLRAFPIYFDACTDGFTVEQNRLGTNERLKEKYGYNTPGPAMNVEK